jgi:hypothetical protein
MNFIVSHELQSNIISSSQTVFQNFRRNFDRLLIFKDRLQLPCQSERVHLWQPTPVAMVTAVGEHAASDVLSRSVLPHVLLSSNCCPLERFIFETFRRLCNFDRYFSTEYFIFPLSQKINLVKYPLWSRSIKCILFLGKHSSRTMVVTFSSIAPLAANGNESRRLNLHCTT